MQARQWSRGPVWRLAALDRFKALGMRRSAATTGESDLAALLGDVRQGQGRGATPRGTSVLSAPAKAARASRSPGASSKVASGVKFDEIALFVRAADRYVGLLEHAFRRVALRPANDSGIPAFFDRGSRRPHPAGRAFLALLACRCEKLSARRFAEYLSLAQVPQLDGKPRELTFVVPDDEVLDGLREAADGLIAAESDEGAAAENVEDSEDVAVIDGSLRAPWKWETLIVESAVIGGDPQRWHRRLDGLDHEYRVDPGGEP